jgi:hypothetical protein
MSELAEEVLEAIVHHTVDTLPDQLLGFYRDPPGRKPHDHVLRIRAALAGIDDAAAKELIRDVVDATVFSLLYLIDSDFRGRGVGTTISRGQDSCELNDSLLHEDYRMKVHPGGERWT